MNPFMMGPLAMTAWSNPDLFSSMMAAQGISPNAIANPMVPAGMDQLDPLAGFMTPSMAGPASPAAAATPEAAAAAATNPLAGMSGLGQVVAPKPTPPIMNAGVSGAQKAPEVTTGAQGSSFQNAVAKLLMNQQSGVSPVPGLPGLMRGLV